MKKILVSLAIMMLLVSPMAHAQTIERVQIESQYQGLLKQLISLLLIQLGQLQERLAVLERANKIQVSQGSPTVESTTIAIEKVVNTPIAPIVPVIEAPKDYGTYVSCATARPMVSGHPSSFSTRNYLFASREDFVKKSYPNSIMQFFECEDRKFTIEMTADEWRSFKSSDSYMSYYVVETGVPVTNAFGTTVEGQTRYDDGKVETVRIPVGN